VDLPYGEVAKLLRETGVVDFGLNSLVYRRTRYSSAVTEYMAKFYSIAFIVYRISV